MFSKFYKPVIPVLYKTNVSAFAHNKEKHSKTCLKRTPTGPQLTVRFNEVSALERVGQKCNTFQFICFLLMS